MKGNNVEPKSANKISTFPNGFSNSTEKEKLATKERDGEKERKIEFSFFGMKQIFPHSSLRVVIELEKGKSSWFTMNTPVGAGMNCYESSLQTRRAGRKFHQWFVENVVRAQVASFNGRWVRNPSCIAIPISIYIRKNISLRILLLLRYESQRGVGQTSSRATGLFL
jgi:hypothetical protein